MGQSSLIARAGIVLPPLGLGGAAIGGLYEEVADDQAVATVHRALGLGLTYLDTAPHYGLGESERRLGLALAGMPRDGYVISTKVGRRLRPRAPDEVVDGESYAGGPPLARVWDFSRQGVIRSLHESLERLGLERVDLLYVHDPDHHEPEAVASAFPALAQLRADGVIGAIGAGMNQAEMLARFVSAVDLDVVLVAGRYSLLDQSALVELLPACAARGVAVVVGGALNSGLLADPRPGAPFDYRPAPASLVQRAASMREVCAAHDTTLLAAALQFPLAHPAVESVLVGARSPAEVEANAEAFATPVPAAAWEALRRAGLLDPDVPVPT